MPCARSIPWDSGPSVKTACRRRWKSSSACRTWTWNGTSSGPSSRTRPVKSPGDSNGYKASTAQRFFTAFSRVLSDAANDPAFAAEALALPSETYLAEQLEEVDPDAVHTARNLLRRKVAQTLKGDLLLAYQAGGRTSGPLGAGRPGSGRFATCAFLT